MFIEIVFLLWKIQAGVAEIPVHEPYYGNGFLTFSKQVQQLNFFLNSMFNNLDMLSSTEKCHEHMRIFHDSLNNNTASWARYYADSSGDSVGPGWLTGNTVNLGNFDACVSQKMEELSGNYCWLKVELKGEKVHRSSYPPNNNPIIFSTCVPRSCSTENIQLLTRPLAERLNLTLFVQCQSTRPSFSVPDYLTMFIFSLVGIITISTLFPTEWIEASYPDIHKVWNCFNIQRNINLLSPSRKGTDALGSMYGIRFLSQCGIIWYHVIIITLTGYYPVQNKFYFNEHFRSWTGTVETEIVLVVDSFFLMSGLLLTYTSLEKKSKFNLWLHYLHRYFRLTVPVIATILFVSTFCNKLCSGPLCKIGIDKEKENCEKYWWTNLLYINNIYPGIMKSCAPHTWYLATDWQLYMLVSPLVVITINKWPQHINKLISAIFLVSVISVFIVSIIYDIPTDNLLFTSKNDIDSYYDKMYTSPHRRAGPWAIGMFLGVFLHNIKKNPINLSLKALFLGWLVWAITFCGSIFLDIPFLQESVDPGFLIKAIFNTIQQNIFALSLGWIIFACAVNVSGPLGQFLSWSAFEPLGKLSYSAYLIHKAVVSIYSGETRAPVYFSTISQLPEIVGLIVVSYIAAFLLYLTFEAPFIHIEKLIIQTASSGTGHPSGTLELTNTSTDNNQRINEIHNSKSN